MAWQPGRVIDFHGQVVLVTGAGRGLGAAYARLIASRGGTVAVHDGGVEPDCTGSDAGIAWAVRDGLVEARGRHLRPQGCAPFRFPVECQTCGAAGRPRRPAMSRAARPGRCRAV